METVSKGRRHKKTVKRVTLALIELVVTTLLLFQNDKNDDFCLKPPPPHLVTMSFFLPFFGTASLTYAKWGEGLVSHLFFHSIQKD